MAHSSSDQKRSVKVHVVTVSTSRTAQSDVSGPLVSELVLGHGHQLGGSTLVADDPEAIGRTLEGLLGDPNNEAIVFTGGTGISARDCTPSVVRRYLDRELPGFGELFRMLSFAEVGAMAMLSTAVGGVARGRAVFAIPGSPKACTLALSKLILPALSHIVEEVHKETPLPGKNAAPAKTVGKTEANPGDPAGKATPFGKTGSEKTGTPVVPTTVPPVPDGISLTAFPDAERPPEDELPTGWRAALRTLQGTLSVREIGEIPASLEKMRAAMDVLDAAGERGVVTLPDGRKYIAFGYPDLVRNGAKVLLLREAEPVAEIVALHRWPRKVGLCAEGEGGLMVSADLDPGPISEEQTGRAYEGNGRLFAIDGKSIYLLEGRKVATWDGRKLGGGDPISSTVGSLLLHWSQR